MEQEIEEWRQFRDSYYWVSNLGRVKSIGRTMPHKSGIMCNLKDMYYAGRKVKGKKYLSIGLSSTINKHLKIHRMVGEVFIPNPNNYDQINHINAIHDDNRAVNLEWCTGEMNRAHAAQMGLIPCKEQMPAAKLNMEKVREIRRLYKEGAGSQRSLAKEFGVTKTAIAVIVRNEGWKE